MAWTKHFSVIKSAPVVPSGDRSQAYSSMTARTSSWLNIAYQGNPQRIPRYYQFQEMDNDSDINTALDTIADFCTQSEEQSDEPFEVKFNGDPNESETKIINQMLDRWIKVNNFRSRLWYMFRDTIKNGDAFFLRDPETFEWLWMDHFMVELVKVDETKGKVPDEYIVRGLDYNRQAKFATKQADPNAYRTPFGTSTVGGARPVGGSASSPSNFSMIGSDGDQRQRGMQGPYSQELSVIDAQYVVHLSLSIGNDINWPFGPSILEPVFKTFKQKELLEDAIIIYRVQRAPERRIFYIDVGTMPPERAKRHIEAIKNDIHQRRIPNRTGTGGSIMDAAYNPLCISLQTILPVVDGRSLTLFQIITEYEQGKENWVYSVNPMTGEVLTAPITWAGITRKNTNVVCVVFDNGGSVIVTPDHKFPLYGGDLIQAQDLTPQHSLLTRERYTQVENGQTVRTGHGENNMIVHAVSVVPLQDAIDTGTITVDKDEIYSPFHNFAISENVFLQNSINDDYFFANNCLSTETNILLLDGRTLTLADIIKEHEMGKENFVYSQNASHEMEAGRIVWAGVTRKDAEVVRVTLDNGEYIDTTPDHRFIARDGSEIEAGQLAVGESLMPLYLRYGRTGPNQKNAGYTRHLCNKTGKTKFVHSTICPKPSGREWVVHHKDYDALNNNPTNLQVMTWKDHEDHHRAIGTYSLRRQWNDPIARENIIAGMQRLYKTADEDFRQRLSARNSVNGSKTWDNVVGNERDILASKLAAARAIAAHDNRLKYSFEMFERVAELAPENNFSGVKLSKLLKSDQIFQTAFRQANAGTFREANSKRVAGYVDHQVLSRIVQVGGYNGWVDFKQNYRKNHKVVSVEVLPYRIDTGDITIETPSDSHIFALAAGIFVHNSEGRGSKVETLPGGDGNNEILDLTFFSKKLARGLRVPVSYLNIGDDSSSSVTFNDGKLGAAMIQEYRFTKYCMRLQALLAPIFDREFKRYLQKNGIEIEPGLFELRFNPPQSFTRYRQIELDTQRVAVYQGVAENKKLAERFKLKRFLGLSEDEIIENEELWSEENADKLKKKTGASPAESGQADGLGAVGIHPEGDMGAMGEMPDTEMPEGDDAQAGTPGAPPAAPAGAGPAGAAPGGTPPAG